MSSLHQNSSKKVRKFTKEEIEPTDPTTSLLISLADMVSASLEQNLITRAMDCADEKQVPKKAPDKVKDIIESFRKWVVPIRESASLVDILNAGWECNNDENLWANVPQIKGNKKDDMRKNRDRVLRDIMLKSLEIAEIYKRLEKIL